MSKSDMVYRYTASKIEYLHSIADTGRGKGYLAELRHGIGKKPGELPSLWCYLTSIIRIFDTQNTKSE